MTIYTAASQAISRLISRKLPSVVASQEEIAVEITSLAWEAAVDIAKSHDWQAITEYTEIEGNGTDTEFPLPTDYDRMLMASELFDPNTWAWNYWHITDYSAWVFQTSRGMTITPGAWMIRKNKFHFSPAPAADQKATFAYIGKNLFLSAGGTPQQDIIRDDDIFVLSERLLTLSLIWRWKQMKQMSYSEDYDLYFNALSQEAARDGGSRVITGRSRNSFPGAVNAWPWPLGQSS